MNTNYPAGASTVDGKILKLGYKLRQHFPHSVFSRVKIIGDLAYVSGHGPFSESGELLFPGRLGENVSIKQGYEAARLTAVNCLSALRLELGDLDRIVEAVKVLVFVNCTSDFLDHPAVANGASSLLRDVLGEHGSHIRSAIGAPSLPKNQCVEAEMLFRVRFEQL